MTYTNMKGIHFFWITKASIDLHVKDFKLDERYSAAKTISGIRSHHAFVRVSKSSVMMRRIFLDSFETVTLITHIDNCNQPEDVTTEESEQQATEDRLDATTYQSGLYMATIFDHKVYIGLITDH